MQNVSQIKAISNKPKIISCDLAMVILLQNPSKNSDKFSNLSLTLFFCLVDEEKIDERAKMSVAAKRSLFRVSNLCSIHNLLYEIT